MLVNLLGGAHDSLRPQNRESLPVQDFKGVRSPLGEELESSTLKIASENSARGGYPYLTLIYRF